MDKAELLNVNSSYFMQVVEGSEHFGTIEQIIHYLEVCQEYDHEDFKIRKAIQHLKQSIAEGYELRKEPVQNFNLAQHSMAAPAVIEQFRYVPYQVCPLCDGTGTYQVPGISAGTCTCPVCNGRRIIAMSEL